jgi:hypothetical protein
MSSHLAAFFLLLTVSVAAGGEAPTIDKLSPAGGQRGTSFEVKFGGKPGDGDLRMISEAQSISIVLNEKRDAATLTIASDARPGLHWLRFANADGATELHPFLVGLVPEQTEVEPNNRIADAQVVTIPSVTINGVLEKSRDVDTYAVDLAAGQTLVASMVANEILGSPMDAVLQISTQRGIVVAQNHDDLGLDPRVAFIAPEAGRWYVRTFAFPSAPNSTINFSGSAEYRYRLTLTTAGVVEHSMPLARSKSEEPTTLKLHGWNLNATPYVLSARQSALTDGLALPYSVVTSEIPVVLEDAIGAERLIALPQAISGEITENAADEFRLQATKGQHLRFRIVAQALGSQLDPVLKLADANGKEVREVDDLNKENQDAELAVTIPADGEYRLSVRDRYEHFGPRFYYLLNCEAVTPGFNATVKSTALIVPSDKPLEIPVTIERTNGFAEAVDFRAEGLPEGLTFENVRSEKDGDTSKAVTLKISGAAIADFSGPIRVIAESVDTKVTKPLAYQLVDGTPIHELWLTARPKPAPAP